MRYNLIENGKRTRFIYHNGELLYEKGEENKQSKEETSYQLGAGIEALQRNQKTYYYHQDEQLNTALITNRNGEIKNRYQYDVFGNGLETIEELPNRIRYTGQQYDQQTEQYYLRARYYNPIVGRFMQEDVYQGDGLNLYAYCRNSPVVYYDPSGYVQNNINGISCEEARFGKDDESGSGTKDIYRAVSPDEYDDIIVNKFRGRSDGMSLQAKEFGNSFDETLDFANKSINSDKAAIIKVTIPENIYNQLNHMQLDSSIFKSGTPVVEPEMLDIFNSKIISIEHVF